MHALIKQQTEVLTPAAKTLARQLQQSLSALERVPGLLLELVGTQGADALLCGVPVADAELGQALLFSVEGIPDFEIRLTGPKGLGFDLAEIAVRSVLDRLEVEGREEILLDELGANWESLEALYEISTDVLRFGDVKSALKRLIHRFVSLQDGLHACLLLSSNELLERIVSSHDCPERFNWSDLGPIEGPMRKNRATIIGHPPEWSGVVGTIPWRGATMLAAAPLTSRGQPANGLMIAWREDKRFVFDAPFSRLLEAMTYQSSMLLESDSLNRATRENERLAQEIEIASSIQQTLLMGHPPQGVPRLEIAASSAASQQIDGDFHDFLRHGDAVDVVIGDVMGKGVAAALLGAAAKSQFLRAIANLALRGTTPSPGEIVRRAASRLNERLITVERFVTLCYARFDPPHGTLEFVDCGHTGILVHRKRTGETFFLRGEDLPLGISTECDFEQRRATIMPGDTFLLFSDGVTETRNPAGDLFGEERLIEALETWNSLGPSTLLRQIKKSAEQFRQSAPQVDDFTCVAVRVGVETTVDATERSAREFFCDLGQLDGVRDWLRDVAQAARIEPDRRARLVNAGLEVFVNCLRHGSAGECVYPVFLDTATFLTHVTIKLRHRGPAFDPLEVPPPSFDGSRDGGFGTFIIMRSADQLEYRREGEINVISISVFRGTE